MVYKIYQNKKQKWVLRHEDGKKQMGEFDTKEAAILFSSTLAKRCRLTVKLVA